MPLAKNDRAVDALFFVVALAVLVGAFAALGMGYDGDAMCYLIWGRELVTGQPLTCHNPSYTTPKILPVLLMGVGHWMPGPRGAEFFYAFVTAMAGAGVVVLTCRLARRLGGRLAGWLALPLALGHMQLVRYVLNGQSTVYASLFTLGALLFATREAVGWRDGLWAALLIVLASLCRPEAAALGGGLALAVYLRVGWRRVGWPAVLLLLGVGAVGLNLLFHRVAFGSFSYNIDLVLEDTAVLEKVLPSLTVGFAVRVVKTLLYYVNRSWVLVLLAGVGAGAAMGRGGWRRYGALVLFPVATAAVVWLLLLRGYLFNERCFFYAAFVAAALGAAGLAALTRWAGSAAEFLGGLSPHWRQAGLIALAFAALAPVYFARPLPRDTSVDYAALRRASEFLRGQLAGAEGRPRVVVSREAGYVFYCLGLRPDESCLLARRVQRLEGGVLPPDVEWAVANDGDLEWEFPPSWGFREVWTDPSGRSHVFRRDRRGADRGGER